MTVALDTQTLFTARVVGITGAVNVGDCLVLNATGDSFIVSTSANRTATGRRSGCIAKTSGDPTNPFVEAQIVGLIPASVSGLGAGTASTIRVSTTGRLERGGSGADDIVGRCDTDGTAYILFGGLTSSGGGGGGTPGTPDRAVQFDNAGIFGGSADAAIDTDGVLRLGVSLGGTAATTGNLRFHDGGLDGTGFIARTHSGASNTDVGTLFAFSETLGGTPSTVVGLGNWAFGGTENTRTPDLIWLTANKNVSWFFSTATPQAIYCGMSLDEYNSAGPIVGWNHRRIMSAQRHTNMALWGSRSTLANPEDALGQGEGVFYFGFAEANPSTNPNSGAIVYCNGADGEMYYRKTDGTVRAMWGSGGGGEANTASNQGAGAGWFKGKVGVDLQFKSAVAGTGISITNNASDLTLASTITAANIGSGAGTIFTSMSGATMQLKTIKAGSNITVTNNANDITLAGTGEANTASNVGSGAGQIYKQKTGVNLELRNLIAGSGVTITTGASDVTISATGGGGTAAGSTGDFQINGGGGVFAAAPVNYTGGLMSIAATITGQVLGGTGPLKMSVATISPVGTYTFTSSYQPIILVNGGTDPIPFVVLPSVTGAVYFVYVQSGNCYFGVGPNGSDTFVGGGGAVLVNIGGRYVKL